MVLGTIVVAVTIVLKKAGVLNPPNHGGNKWVIRKNPLVMSAGFEPNMLFN
jgi:hypothetical protein